jgi:hypothetical protein
VVLEKGIGVRSPRELIEIYWEQIYNNGEVELVREVCADPIVRHDPGCVTPLSHDEQIVRIKRSLAVKPLFTHRVLHADDCFVTSVWNMVSRDGRNIELCGIEVFEATDGRFTRCWNSTYMKGMWGEDGNLFDPAALSPPALAAGPGDVTADWLQRAFAAGGEVEVQRMAMEPEVTPLGHGTTSMVLKVRATYNSGEITAPRSAILKIGKQAGAGGISPFERELRAYQFFGKAPPFRVPKLYYGASGDTGLHNLLIEDLSGTARAGDQIPGCTIAEAAVVVRELGLFHRTYWQASYTQTLDWLSQPRDWLPAFAKGATVLRDWLGGRISAKALELIDHFGEVAGQWLDQQSAHRTLIHCDPRVDNVLFEETGDGLRACLIDWQSLGAGDPQYDVAYFLTGSLSPKDRRACERDLVAEHAKLIAEVDPAYNADLALAAYRRNVVSGLWLTVIAAAHVERNSHNAKLLEVLVHRNSSAVFDWGGLEAIA